MKRRTFIQGTARAAAAAVMYPHLKLLAAETPDLVVVTRGEPADLVRNAVDVLGGMARFVSRGDIVVLKPNISWDRMPVHAATTNPDVVAEVVKLCFEAGAKKVKIFDRTLNDPKRCYKRSGIQKAAEAQGAEVRYVREMKFKMTDIPDGALIRQWEFHEDVMEADRIINVPIAKHHAVGGASLGLKNFMGVLGGDRGLLHRDFSRKIVDINTAIKADLTILDAYRILLRNGPSGGNLADVALKKTIVAGTDPVTVDAYGMTLFDRDPSEVEFLKEAAARGLGEPDLTKKTIREIDLSS